MNRSAFRGARLGAVVSRDGLGGLAVIAFALFALYINRDLDVGTPTDMGPGFLPRLLALALILAGGWILGRGLLAGVRDVTLGALRAAPWRALVIVSAGILVFALLIDRAGLVLTSLVQLGLTGFAARRWRPFETAIFALAMTGLVAAIFVWGLKVPIPMWPQP